MGLQTTVYRSANRGYWEGLVAEPENPLALASKQVNMKLPLSPAGTRNSAGVLLFNEAQVCSFKHVPIPVQPWWNRKTTVIGPIDTPAQMWLQGPSGCMLWSPGGKKAGETTAPERGSKRNKNQKEKRILQGRKQKKQEATRGKGDGSLRMKLAMAA
jgi:hypothetical protein